ncbi:papain like cysteine protease AvrRpt2 [Tenacibaculum skagerrakense]|uniref:Papain like cysteine protease AvrRpt2 n=1 Tax=Tenacibaculum skagerrakense TaxID=186571 RepID=A0A4R2NPN5_9FLAO|nr:M12 family metallopeptidase [Tenacibaculum skagerrakense]TCP23622.1 papain like cysteine protease AvrRpt2 [Tenacibaculum skagerrakense]
MKSNKYIRILTAMLFGFFLQVTVAQEGYPDNTSGTTREINTTLPFTNVQTTIKVKEIDNKYIFEGDILIPRSGGRGGAVTTSTSARWPNSKMPYVIASGHPKRADILWAINHISTSTNVCIVPRTTESDYVEFIYTPGICGLSFIGKTGGRQVIEIGDRCGSKTKGSTTHEIMHALGFYHEQSRDDRDTYITVNGSNITSGNAHNFRKYNQSWYHYFWPEGRNMGNYDYGSIMHYGPTAFGKPKPGGGRMTTIVPKRSGVTIGQRNSMSATDIASINGIYPTACSTSSSTSTTASSDDPGTSDSNSSTSSTSGSLDISYPIQLVPQTSGMSCWAASAAMIVGWREQISIDPQDIARGVNGWESYYNNGLPPDNTEMFSVWGLQYDYPQSYTVEGFASLLQGGPLWVATNLQNGAHVVVVAGIRGDGTPDGTILKVYDPLEQGMTNFRSSNRGSVYEMTYQEFVNRQETLAFRELSEPSAFYVAY